MKHKIKETAKNYLLRARSIFNYIRYDGNGSVINPPKGYSKVFEDEFTSKLNNKSWGYAQPWGDFHSGDLHQRYDTYGTYSYTSSEGLVLELRNVPRTYKKSDLPDWRQNSNMPDEFTIPVIVGMVHSKMNWQYGWFEGLIKLPKGQSYWPAFWLSGSNSWPPEIDIFEAYSEIGPEYNKKLISDKFISVPDWKIQPNLHYGSIENGTKKMYGPYNSPIAECTERFVQYVCHWEKNFIKIYYDGSLIFECKDPDILNFYNGNKDQMYMIINHGAHPDSSGINDESAMLIRSIKVYQNKE